MASSCQTGLQAAWWKSSLLLQRIICRWRPDLTSFMCFHVFQSSTSPGTWDVCWRGEIWGRCGCRVMVTAKSRKGHEPMSTHTSHSLEIWPSANKKLSKYHSPDFPWPLYIKLRYSLAFTQSIHSAEDRMEGVDECEAEVYEDRRLIFIHFIALSGSLPPPPPPQCSSPLPSFWARETKQDRIKQKVIREKIQWLGCTWKA